MRSWRGDGARFGESLSSGDCGGDAIGGRRPREDMGRGGQTSREPARKADVQRGLQGRMRRAQSASRSSMAQYAVQLLPGSEETQRSAESKTLKVLAFLCIASSLGSGANVPVFYRDVLPILQSHCQKCHRDGEIAPFPLVTYAQARPYAAEIRNQTGARNMPPWFADPCCGHFANDPSLAPEQIATLAAWADAHAPAGNPRAAPPEAHWSRGWNIDKPDAVFEMPRPIELTSEGDVPYTYVIIPTHFTEDRWVRMSEVRPSNRAVVHHAVAYIREPGSRWLKGAPTGVAFTAQDLADPQLLRDARSEEH